MWVAAMDHRCRREATRDGELLAVVLRSGAEASVEMQELVPATGRAVATPARVRATGRSVEKQAQVRIGRHREGDSTMRSVSTMAMAVVVAASLVDAVASMAEAAVPMLARAMGAVGGTMMPITVPSMVSFILARETSFTTISATAIDGDTNSELLAVVSTILVVVEAMAERL